MCMKKNKKIKILLAILIICLIGTICYLMMNPISIANRKLNKINVSDYMDDDLILPKGLYKLVDNYKGNLSTEIICKTYNNFSFNIVPVLI